MSTLEARTETKLRQDAVAGLRNRAIIKLETA